MDNPAALPDGMGRLSLAPVPALYTAGPPTSKPARRRGGIGDALIISSIRVNIIQVNSLLNPGFNSINSKSGQSRRA
jgi:hypothetical protein